MTWLTESRMIKIFLSVIVLLCICFLGENYSIHFKRFPRIKKLPSHSVGIDLGTTFSLVSLPQSSTITELVRIGDSFLLPSIVSYQSNDQIIVGNQAKLLKLSDPLNTFSSFKRIIGKTLGDAIHSQDKYSFGKALRAYASEDKSIEYCGLYCERLKRILTPIELSSEIIKELLNAASSKIGNQHISNAVITVPAYFTAKQREATIEAGKLAGLDKIKLLKEPEAAAIAYGFLEQKPKIVLIVDIGGGTFDVSVLEIGNGLVEVISTGGDPNLGGDDFDHLLFDFILSHFSKSVINQVHLCPIHKNSVKEKAIQAKLDLSDKLIVEFSLELFGETKLITIHRKKFFKLCSPLLKRVLRPIRQACLFAGVNLQGESGKLSFSDFDEENEEDENISEVHGILDYNLAQMKHSQIEGKRLAKLKQKVQGESRKELNRLRKSSSNSKNSASLELFPTGRALDEVILVGGTSRMPSILRMIKTITGLTPRRNINPDEAVCLGAGIYAGIFDGKINNLHVLSSFQSSLLRTINELKDIYPDSFRGNEPTSNEFINPSPPIFTQYNQTKNSTSSNKLFKFRTTIQKEN